MDEGHYWLFARDALTCLTGDVIIIIIIITYSTTTTIIIIIRRTHVDPARLEHIHLWLCKI